MMKMSRIVWVVVSVLVIPAAACLAIDYGAPIYSDNYDAKVQVEAIFDRFDRDVKVGSTKKDMDQNLYILRLNVPGTVASSYFDAGILDDDLKDGGTPLVAGAGVSILAHDTQYVRVNVLFNGHYVPSYDIKTSEYFTGEKHYYEVGAGLILSGKLGTELDEWQFIPYAGLMFSLLRGKEKIKIDPPADGRSSLNYDIEEKDVLVGVIGFSVIAMERFSLRVEGDLIADKSFSAALGIAF